MPPFGGEKFRVTPKSEAEKQAEQDLAAKVRFAYDKADELLPFRRTRREGALATGKTVYQTPGQNGEPVYTRAWLVRSGTDERAPIQVHTDVVAINGSEGPQSIDMGVGTKRVGLTPNWLEIGGINSLNTAQKTELAIAAIDTLELISQEQFAASLREAR